MKGMNEPGIRRASRNGCGRQTRAVTVVALLLAMAAFLSACGGRRTPPSSVGTVSDSEAVTEAAAVSEADRESESATASLPDTESEALPESLRETAPETAADSETPVESAADKETAADPEAVPETEPSSGIKNVIFLIADGGGYDNFELANQTKEALFKQGLTGLGDTARTPLTNGRLADYGYDNGTGLYLNRFLVGSSDTLLEIPHGSDPAIQYITDSSAAGTALSSGCKTVYCYAGIDSDRQPRASLTELSQMNGMLTGIVSTKSFVDATPLAFFTSHSIHRYEYQDTSLQALLSGVDVVLVEGTAYGDIPDGGGASSHLGAREAGYTVLQSRTSLLRAADKGLSKVWGAFPGRKNGSLVYASSDRAADHITYDVDGAERDEPTLLDMTAAALQLLGGQNDPDGFFLMVEGGALDNAAEHGKLKYAVGEALAFDETFAYCVEWAKQHGDDTLVIATADHDSGGFWGIEKRRARLIDAMIKGQFPDGTPITIQHDFHDYREQINLGSTAGIYSGHSDMPVPVWMYAPEGLRDAVLGSLGIPTDTSPDQIRFSDKGQYYDLSAINDKYLIDNTAMAPAIAELMGAVTLEEATAELYVPVATYHADGTVTCHGGITEGRLSFGPKDTRIIGGTTVAYYPVTFTCGDFTFRRNSTEYEKDGQTVSFARVGNHQPIALYITTERAGSEGVKTGTFYLPAKTVEMLTKP